VDDLQWKYTLFNITNESKYIIRNITNIREPVVDLNSIADIMIIVMVRNV